MFDKNTNAKFPNYRQHFTFAVAAAQFHLQIERVPVPLVDVIRQKNWCKQSIKFSCCIHLPSTSRFRFNSVVVESSSCLSNQLKVSG